MVTSLKFIYSITDSHNIYLPRRQKKLATPLILLSKVKTYVV